MRVLAIFPGMDKRFNDNAYALIQLRRMGIELVIITSRNSDLKYSQLSPEYEDMDGIPIHRVYRNYSEQTSWPLKKYDLVRDISARLNPDLILCSQQLNMPIANRLKAEFGVPIVLLVEFAHDPKLLLGRRRLYLSFDPIAPFIAKLYWHWLCVSSKAIITCNPSDKRYLYKLGALGTPVHFVGWCNEKPEGARSFPKNKHRDKGIYAGSLQKKSFKNSEELIKTIPGILENTPTKEFVIIGNGSLVEEIKELVFQWNGRVRYIKELSRRDVWELITESFFAYTPVKYGGWGFIGDAWSARTPLVVTHNGYEFMNEEDALISDVNSIDSAITELYNNNGLYVKLQEGGESRYNRFHTAERVAQDIYRVFQECL